MENQYSNSTLVKNSSRGKFFIPSSFALAIFFFFFTFCDFKCNANQQKIGSVTGINLVTGTEFKRTSSELSMNTDLGFGKDWNPNKTVKQKETTQTIPANIWAILAMLSALIGCVSFLLKAVKENLIGTATGLVAAISLIALQLSFRNVIESQSEGQVEAIFQFAYWASLTLVSVAGVLSYLQLKNSSINHEVSQSGQPSQQDSKKYLTVGIVLMEGLVALYLIYVWLPYVISLSANTVYLLSMVAIIPLIFWGVIKFNKFLISKF
jgi:hypothetical protein